MSGITESEILPLFGPTCGAVFFGTILTTAFYGVTCVQTFFYYVHYQRDPWLTKAFVALMWSLNTIHEALVVSGTYKYFMAILYNPLAVLQEPPELVVQILPTNSTAVLTQGFLLYRVYILSGKFAALVIAVVLGLTQVVSTVVYLSKALYSNGSGVVAVDVSTLGGSYLVNMGTLGLSVAAGEDILIAMLMTFLLVRQRATTGFSRTAHILQRLIVFAVNTGAWSATFAVLSVIFMHAFTYPRTILFAAILIPLCPVYCNTVLANLNGRVYISNRGTETTDYFGSTTLLGSEARQRDGIPLVSPPRKGVMKTTEIATFSDTDQSMIV